MKTYRIGVLFFCVTFFGSVNAWAEATAGIFDFVLTRYPYLKSSCDTTKSLGEVFAQQTGLTVFKTECKPYDFANDTVTIWYAAPQRLPFVSTDSTLVTSTGFYSSLANCEKDLTNQVSQFQAETGISPIFARCFQDQDSGAHAFSSRIDGLLTGTPKKFAFAYSGVVFGTPVEPEASIVAELKSTQSKLGIDISLGAIGNSFSDPNSFELAFRYYAKVSLDGSLELRNYASEDTQVCLQQEQGLRNLMQAETITPATVFCADDSSLNETNLHILFNRVVPWYREENVSGTYPSFVACEGDKARVVDFYKANLGKNPFGGLCVSDSFDPSIYRMRVLTTCTPDNVTPECELGTDWSNPFPGIPGVGSLR